MTVVTPILKVAPELCVFDELVTATLSETVGAVQLAVTVLGAPLSVWLPGQPVQVGGVTSEYCDDYEFREHVIE